MDKRFTFTQFLKKYPNDGACLSFIWNMVYPNQAGCPKCGVVTKFHKIEGRLAYACQEGCHIYPLAATKLKDTKLPLTNWLFCIFLFSNSKNGVSAKELQRQLGVSYPTAWRMGHIIRSMMNDQNEIILSGDVEMDETLVGGKQRGGKRGWGSDKPCVFGIVERGGNIKTFVVPNRKAETILPIITENTTEETTAYTDDFHVYRNLEKKASIEGHGTVYHKLGEHVSGINPEIHTQTIDGHWSLIKRSLKGTHVYVSRKYLQNYLNEFSFRRNHRTEVMFDAIVNRISAKAS